MTIQNGKIKITYLPINDRYRVEPSRANKRLEILEGNEDKRATKKREIIIYYDIYHCIIATVQIQPDGRKDL